MRTNENKSKILRAFDTYRNIVFATDTDLNFWKSFLDTSISSYKLNNPNQVGLYEAGFCVYEYNAKYDGILKGHKTNRSIETGNLETYKNEFISWISNLATLKVYNALENFILQAIHIRYFPENKQIIGSKKAIDKLNKDIKAYLSNNSLSIDTKNNRHIIQFLKSRSSSVAIFLERRMNVDITTNWENFFELISILRNIIAHQGTIVSLDTQSAIQSKAKDIFKRHFSIIKDDLGIRHLHPNDINGEYSNFISLFNSFSLHIVQCMFNEEDLKFLEMY